MSEMVGFRRWMSLRSAFMLGLSIGCIGGGCLSMRTAHKSESNQKALVTATADSKSELLAANAAESLPCGKCIADRSICASMAYQLFSGQAFSVVCEQLKQPS